MDTHAAMDLFGQALYAYWKGDRTPMYFIYEGVRTPRSMVHYFRPPSRLTKVEKELISLVHGHILDVGCATGYYVPELAKHGEVDAIDISPGAIQVAHERGIDECFLADVFAYYPGRRYDTVTLLENNLGMGGSIERADALLCTLASLLATGGQILMAQREIPQEWVIRELTIEYKGAQSTFPWLHLSSKTVRRLCENNGLAFEILMRGKHQMYLAKVTV